MRYMNGRLAKVGDKVVGTCFNTLDENGKKRIVSGTLVSVTPGNDSCSAMVAFVEVYPAEVGKIPYNAQTCRVQGDEAHGLAGTLRVAGILMSMAMMRLGYVAGE